MGSTPEKDNIDSKRMCVESMTEKGEVSFAEECKRLLDHCDEIGTKGDKKHAKREAKARLNHKYTIKAYILRQILLLPSLSWLQCCPETILSQLFENA